MKKTIYWEELLKKGKIGDYCEGEDTWPIQYTAKIINAEKGISNEYTQDNKALLITAMSRGTRARFPYELTKAKHIKWKNITKEIARTNKRGQNGR